MTVKPQIIMSGADPGAHNAQLAKARRRLTAGKAYADLSTVCVIPTRGAIPARIVESWWGLMSPMNHKFTRIMVRGMEVGDAYNQAIELILDHPELSKWRYILTLEEDNAPPADGLLRLLEAAEKHPEYAAIGGLYWTKGEAGQPMIYGDPKAPLAFQPQVPRHETVQECNGLGMGFTLFRTEQFRALPKPWFVTQQANGHQFTQDLFHFDKARRAGLRVACHTGVKVGHYSATDDRMW